MATVTIEAAPWTLETAAALLLTYADRGPSSDRAVIERIASEFQAAAAQEAADLGDDPLGDWHGRNE